MHNWEQIFWKHPYGVNRVQEGLQVSLVSQKEDCGIVFYEANSDKEVKRVPFDKANKIGNVYYMNINNMPDNASSYLFYEEDRLIVDPWAYKYIGTDTFGVPKGPLDFRASFDSVKYDWENDKFPMLQYEDSIVYGIHVRGFTMHASSGVKGKGTFAGLIEKIPYLRDLGITTVELQPIYEFNEMPKQKTEKKNNPTLTEVPKLNYWGYQEAFYYAPKRAYSLGDDATVECKNMIKAFHKQNMEVIMQVYFKTDTPVIEIINVLRFWHIVYHVDGFRLIGDIPQIKEIVRDAYLQKCKLMYQQFPVSELYASHEKPIYRNLATCNDGYMYDMRRFLKGDEGMLYEVMKHMRINPATHGVINYITNYYGFTMADLFSYDRKYNEDNGEDNKDGIDYNFSWNCGAEGSTRKKQVLALRSKQIKNAFALLILSQGTPCFRMGDEFCNSQRGNNNPYCQDNDITWLNWKDLKKNHEIYSFVKELIAMRMSMRVFSQSKECMIMDYKSCGCPDISYHGEEAWKPCWEHYSRQIGFMYCGDYADGCKGKYYYVAINMHWEDHSFALPKLPKNKVWKRLLTTTSKEGVVPENTKDVISPVYTIEKRSIAAFIGE